MPLATDLLIRYVPVSNTSVIGAKSLAPWLSAPFGGEWSSCEKFLRITSVLDRNQRPVGAPVLASGGKGFLELELTICSKVDCNLVRPAPADSREASFSGGRGGSGCHQNIAPHS